MKLGNNTNLHFGSKYDNLPDLSRFRKPTTPPKSKFADLPDLSGFRKPKKPSKSIFSGIRRTLATIFRRR